MSDNKQVIENAELVEAGAEALGVANRAADRVITDQEWTAEAAAIRVSDEREEAEVNPYAIEVTDVDVSFQTNVTPGDGDQLTLGDAAEVAAINLIRVGLDNYRVLYTDRSTGRQWIGEDGYFIPLPSREEEQGATAQ